MTETEKKMETETLEISGMSGIRPFRKMNGAFPDRNKFR